MRFRSIMQDKQVVASCVELKAINFIGSMGDYSHAEVHFATARS